MFGYRDKRVELADRQDSIIRLPAFLALLGAAFCAYGQAPKQPVSQPVDMSINADEVSLDLVVHDKKSRPVLDLKPEEIAVTDSGSPVKLSSLRLVGKEENGERLITLVFDRPGPVAGTSQETDPSMMKNARDAAAKILKMVPERGFSFSVLSVEGRLRLQSGFTADRKALALAIDAATQPARGGNGSVLVSEPEKQIVAAALSGADLSGKLVTTKAQAQAQVMLSALNESGRIAQDQHIRPFLAGLLALAQSQQQIKQRKALIFFTSFLGGQVDLRSMDAIKSIVGSANQAGESIYVVDLNSSDLHASQISAQAAQATGLYPGSMGEKGSSLASFSPNSNLVRMGNLGTEALMDTGPQHDDLKGLAEGTGGSYVTQAHLEKSLGQMIQDMTTYYVASYTPPNKEYDGKFHPVAVKALRSGLNIRMQTGFLALPPRVGETTPQPFELPLLKVLGQPQLPADLSFHAAILRMGDLPDGNVYTLAIEVPIANLDIREDSSTALRSASLSIIADIKDKSGMIVERFSADIPRRRMLKGGEKEEYGAVSFQRHFVDPAGQYTLEAAVQDHYSGKIGAQRIPFEVTGASGSPSLGEIVLVRQAEPFRAEDDPTEPLHHGSEKLTPNLSGVLPPDAKSVSVFFTTHADPHAAEAATIQIEVLRDGKPLGGEPMVSSLAKDREFSSFLSSFSIDPPVRGYYDVRATVSQSGKSAHAHASFILAGVQTDIEKAGPAADDPPASPRRAGQLVITIPATPLQRPAPEELQSILADATKYAMEYRASLPNLMCERVTNRSFSLNGASAWKHKDKFTELLTYVNHEESPILLDLELNGSTSREHTGNSKGVISAGEFGVAFSGLFRPASKAEFQWKETGMLGDGVVQIFDYRVARENSIFNLRVGSNEVITVGYHGQVFIDSDTRAVRRITEIVDDVPDKFPIRGVTVSVDYDYVAINNHDYMLPVGAQVLLRKGRREEDLNEIDYRNFHRFGSNSRILDYTPINP